jgi:hypothetical protein
VERTEFHANLLGFVIISELAVTMGEC